MCLGTGQVGQSYDSYYIQYVSCKVSYSNNTKRTFVTYLRYLSPQIIRYRYPH